MLFLFVLSKDDLGLLPLLNFSLSLIFFLFLDGFLHPLDLINLLLTHGGKVGLLLLLCDSELVVSLCLGLEDLLLECFALSLLLLDLLLGILQDLVVHVSFALLLFLLNSLLLLNLLFEGGFDLRSLLDIVFFFLLDLHLVLVSLQLGHLSPEVSLHVQGHRLSWIVFSLSGSAGGTELLADNGVVDVITERLVFSLI